MDGYKEWGQDESWQEFADAQLDHHETEAQLEQHEHPKHEEPDDNPGKAT